MALKADVSRELERLRVAGEIGAPLEAAAEVYLDEAQHARLAAVGEELRFVLITSEARLRPATERPPEAVAATTIAETGAWIVVRPVKDAKCVRCWHRRADVGADSRHPELCSRCVGNLEGPGESRHWA